jgi:hypothetical protein
LGREPSLALDIPLTISGRQGHAPGLALGLVRHEQAIHRVGQGIHHGGQFGDMGR